MKKVIFSLLFLFSFLFIASCEEADEQKAPPEQRFAEQQETPSPFVQEDTGEISIAQQITDENAPKLTHITTHTMSSGTHRPEIFINNNRLYLLVVEHEGNMRHKGYIFDAAEPSSIDFENPETEFIEL